MPAGLAKCDLASVFSTKEELEAARTILNSAGEKELRSKMGSMSSWLKANPCNDVNSSRGDDRRRFSRGAVEEQADTENHQGHEETR